MSAGQSVSLGIVFTSDATALLQTIELIKNAFFELNVVLQSTNTGVGTVSETTSTYGTALKNTSKKIRTFTKDQVAANKATKSQTGAMARLTSAFKTLAAYMIAGKAIMMFTQSIRAAIDEMVRFDQALYNIKAITGATASEIGIMSTKLEEVAMTTKFSTTEAAEGMVLLGQAGFDASESISAIQSVADLAAGTLSNLKVTSDLLTTTVRAFGLNALESSRAADVMANAINKSKLTIDKLRIAFNFVGATAYQAGVSLEDTATSMMVLANNGLRASTIGTGLRQVLSRLIAPTRKLRQEFTEHNIALEEVNPTIVGYQTALKNLSVLLYDTESGTINMAKAFQLFGLRGSQAAAILLKEVADGGVFDEMYQKTLEVGSAAKMAAIQAKGLQFKLKNLSDVTKVAALRLGDSGFVGTLKILVNTLQTSFRAFVTFTKDGFGKFILQAGYATTVLTLLIVAFNKLGTVVMTAVLIQLNQLKQLLVLLAGEMAAATTATGAFAAALETFWVMTPLIGQVLLVVTAIGGLIVAVNHFISVNRRNIKLLQQEDAVLSNVISSFNRYEGAVNSLIKDKKVGINIDKEYSNLLKRMTKDHKEFTKEIDVSAISIEELSEEIKKARQENELWQIKQTTELIANQEKELAQLSITAAQVSDTFSEQTDIYVESQKSMGIASKEMKTKIDLLVYRLASYSTAMHLTTEESIDLVNSLIKSKKVSSEVGKIIRDKLITNLADLALEAKRVKKIIDSTLNEETFAGFRESLNVLGQTEFDKINRDLRKKLDSIIKLYRDSDGEVTHMYAELEQAKIQHVLKLSNIDKSQLKNEKTTLQENINLLKWYTHTSEELYYDNYIKIYAALDEKRRVIDESVENEYYTLKQAAEQRKKVTQETDESISELHKKREGSLVAQEKALNDLIVEVYTIGTKQIEEEYSKRVTSIENKQNIHLKSLKNELKAELNTNILQSKITEKQEKKKFILQTKYNQQVLNSILRASKEKIKIANDTWKQQINLIEQLPESEIVKNTLIVEADRVLLSEQKKLYQSRIAAYQGMISLLLSEEKQLATAIRRSKQDLIDIEEHTQDALDAVKRKSMTEYEKFESDRNKSLRLLNEGNLKLQQGAYKQAIELFQSAQEAAGNLASEVKQGENIIVDSATSTEVAFRLIKKAGEGAALAEKNHQEKLKGRYTTISDTIQTLSVQVENYKNVILNLSNAKVDIDISPAMSSLQILIKEVQKAIKNVLLLNKKKSDEDEGIKTDVVISTKDGKGKIIDINKETAKIISNVKEIKKEIKGTKTEVVITPPSLDLRTFNRETAQMTDKLDIFSANANRRVEGIKLKSQAAYKYIGESFGSFVGDTIRGEVDSLSDVLIQFLNSIVDAFANAFQDIADDMVSTFVKSKVGNVSLIGLLSSFFGSPMSKAAITYAGTTGYSAPSQAFAGLPVGFASGGIIPEPVVGIGASGQAYTFAENGPERILSNQDSFDNKSDVIVNVINKTSTPVTARVGDTRQQLKNLVTEVILEDRRRGGVISR